MYRYLLQTSFCLLVGVALVVVGAKPNIVTPPDANDVNTVDANTEPHRSPVDLVISHDNSWLVTANQTSNTASLVRVADGTILDEVTVGRRPSGLILSPDGKRVLITASFAGNLVVLEVRENKLVEVARIHVGFDPHGIAIDPNGRTAYVALTAAAKVAVVDLESRTVTDRIDVGRWPNHLALSPDGSRLAVGTSGDRGVSVVDTQTKKMLFIESFIGLNIGHMKVSSDGKHVYFPWVIYRSLPITKQNIQLGWVLATRIGRIQLDGPARRAAVSLDPRGRAISDPCGLAFTSDEKRLVVSASGTHELLVYRADLPFQDSGGTDHIPRQLLNDKDRFDRIELGGRPMGLQIATDDRTVFVANYLDDSIQVVDIVERKLIRSIPLGGPDKPSLARQGEAIFYDGKRSLDQWYSCQTCHQDGGTNSVVMDTLNDGSNLSFKTVLPLYNVSDTAPWTWHGWQTDLHAAMHKSITSTMLGPAPTDADKKALVAFLQSVEPPPNPFRNRDGSLSEAAARGKTVFESTKADCASCHSGRYFTDGDIHEVGLVRSSNKYKGFNTPSLLGVYRKTRLLHDGRSKSLEELLTGPHDPDKVTGEGKLTDQELKDLVEYLKSL